MNGGFIQFRDCSFKEYLSRNLSDKPNPIPSNFCERTLKTNSGIIPEIYIAYVSTTNTVLSVCEFRRLLRSVPGDAVLFIPTQQ